MRSPTDKPLRIAMISSECVPFAKTGGLADVVGALSRKLKELGHDVIVIMPKYSSINAQGHGQRRFWDTLGVWMGGELEWCAIDMADNGGVTTYFVESNKYFNRPGLYHDASYNDYRDNPQRFGFLTRAGLQLCKDMGFAADIIHVHDWQTALAPAYLQTWHANDPILGGAASVLTIHNIAYQGRYPSSVFDYLGLQWSNFTPDKLEDHGAVNFLKGGIHFADALNTVSPTYAEETRTPAMGYGMAPFLNQRGEDYCGILNGVDYGEWNPKTDRLIHSRYSAAELGGKSACKSELQRQLGLEVTPEIPIVGVVSRFASQKGLDLLAGTMEQILSGMRVQFAILGSGDKGLESFFSSLAAKHAGKVGTVIGFNNQLSHQIEAGADFFIMPSLYEPCGLSQLYSLKYGTLPIVRATGGLNDTVDQYDEATGAGTGFKFWEPSAKAIYFTVGWAVSTFYDRKPHMQKMIQTAMAKDFSWETSAQSYLALYERARANRAHR
jgi:starch synthase